MSKGKIAICISGQTRGHNEIRDEFYDGLNAVFGDFDYDLYGHTWTDQEVPANTTDFVKFTYEDQDVIWDYSKIDLFKLMPYNESWLNKTEYQEYLDGTKDIQEFWKFCSDRVKGAFGQIWSAHKCFQSVVLENNYDMIIRYRWDNIVKYEEYKTHKEQLQNILTEYSQNNSIDEVDGNNKIDLLANSNTWLHGNYLIMVDTFFIMSDEVVKRANNIEPGDLIRTIYNNILGDSRPTAHVLWEKYLIDYMNLKTTFLLPQFIEVQYFNDLNSNKTVNRQWNI